MKQLMFLTKPKENESAEDCAERIIAELRGRGFIGEDGAVLLQQGESDTRKPYIDINNQSI